MASVPVSSADFAPGPFEFSHPQLNWEKNSYRGKELLRAFIPADRESDFVKGEGLRTKSDFYEKANSTNDNALKENTVCSSFRSSCCEVCALHGINLLRIAALWHLQLKIGAHYNK